jgi:hypothetical protein
MELAERNLSIRLAVLGSQEATQRFVSFGDVGSRALRQVETGSVLSTKAMQGVAATGRSVETSMQSMALRLGPVGAGLAALGPIGIGAAAGIAAVAFALKSGLGELASAENAQLRIAALLRATESASGQTAASIEALANSIERGTAATDDQVRDAAAALLTFKNVAGDAFERTLRLSQDLSAVFKTDLRTQTIQLAKAIEDPERNLSQLNRSGISFTNTQIEMVKQMRAMGDVSGATALILGVIEKQVGGAGEAERGGLKGAFDNVKDALADFLEVMAKSSGASDVAIAAMDATAAAADNMADALTNTLDKQLAASRARIREIQFELENINRPTLPGASGALQQFFTKDDDITQTTEALERELAAQQDILDILLDEQAARERIAQDAKDAAAAFQERARMEAAAEEARKGAIENRKARLEQLHDQIEEIQKLETEEARKAKSAREDAQRQAASLLKSVQTEGEKLQEIYQKVERLAAAGALTQEQAATIIERTEKAMLKVGSASAKVNEGMRDLSLSISSAFEDAIVDGGRFSEVLRGIERDILRILTRAAITKPLETAIGGIDFGKLLSSGIGLLFGGGTSNAYLNNAALRTSKPGGIGGLASGGSFIVGGDGGTDTTPIRFDATRGERVTVETPAQQARGGQVKVIIVNNVGASVTARESADSGGGVNLEVSIDEAVARQVRRAGSITSRALADTFGAQRILSPR